MSAWSSPIRKLFDGSREEANTASTGGALQGSLEALIDFFPRHAQPRWAEILRSVRTDLQKQATEAQALVRLSSCFGGMGSLNDLVFDSAEADQEGARLLDAVLRDMKLYQGGPGHRAQWRKLEEEHKGELPPRIKHAFRKE